jgi:hypothetical protein
MVEYPEKARAHRVLQKEIGLPQRKRTERAEEKANKA